MIRIFDNVITNCEIGIELPKDANVAIENNKFENNNVDVSYTDWKTNILDINAGHSSKDLTKTDVV